MTRLKKNDNLNWKWDEDFEPSKNSYSKFKKINGKHPFQKETIDSFVAYRARKRHGGKVVVFNYELAREIGLISKTHPNHMTAELEEQLLETFALVIINEYDQINEIEFDKEDIKPNFYMATRYLQLQHPNKQGKTSGDGRSIWNGVHKHKGKTWDISSCGTGATCLSPATHIQNKFFQTGDPTISYGCGYAEVDEGMASLFFSEILNKNKVKTERVLGILQFEDGYAITIRIHDNLLRPSHLFNHLKQSNYDALRAMINYYIKRQEDNGVWENMPKSEKARWDYFLKKQVDVFARTAAKFEDEYIFCWLDWDGDNVLMDGGIIDYGSVRQFGLFHSEYRFDDTDRFSTSIIEQKQKAKYTAQTFCQLVDYLKTGDKKPIKEFAKGQWSEDFEETFWRCKHKNLLYKMGFSGDTAKEILLSNRELVESFQKVFFYFEKAKSHRGPKKVNDGITWDAIYCMRDILREIPQIYLSREKDVERSEFLEIAKSTYASKKDLALTSYKSRKIDEFQALYRELVILGSSIEKTTFNRMLLNISMRSSIINKYDRVTGDSISHITEILMKKIKSMKPDKIYDLLYNFSEYQNLNPDGERVAKSDRPERSQLMRGFLKVVREYREGL